jgi:hypothetical protein
MTDSFYVGGYWGPRAELIEECAERLRSFMCSLVEIDPLVSTWFRPGSSREQALVSEIPPEPDKIFDILLDGEYRDDADKKVIPDLGYRIGLWNGRVPEIGLSVHCGSWSPSAGSSNSVVVNLPSLDNPASRNIYRPGAALALVGSIVETWSPSRVSWTGHDLREAQAAKIGEVVVGWATYLSGERIARAGRLPADVETEAVGDGLIITIGDDPTDVPLDTVMAVREALGPALLPDTH